MSDFTQVRLDLIYDEYNLTAATGDRSRWITRAALHHRILPRVYGTLTYQYEDFHIDGSSGFDEHLYMLSVTHLF